MKQFELKVTFTDGKSASIRFALDKDQFYNAAAELLNAIRVKTLLYQKLKGIAKGQRSLVSTHRSFTVGVYWENREIETSISFGAGAFTSAYFKTQNGVMQFLDAFSEAFEQVYSEVEDFAELQFSEN